MEIVWTIVVVLFFFPLIQLIEDLDERIEALEEPLEKTKKEGKE